MASPAVGKFSSIAAGDGKGVEPSRVKACRADDNIERNMSTVGEVNASFLNACDVSGLERNLYTISS